MAKQEQQPTIKQSEIPKDWGVNSLAHKGIHYMVLESTENGGLKVTEVNKGGVIHKVTEG